jgi:hypothetical protein
VLCKEGRARPHRSEGTAWSGAGTMQHSAGAVPARNRHDGGDDPNANRRDDEVWWRTKDGPMNDVGGRRATAVVEF